MRNLYIFTITVLSAFLLSLVAGNCPWQGEEHPLGSTWNPPAFPCVNCSCILGFSDEPKVSCVNEQCPKLNCSEEKIRTHIGKCCPYCEVTAEGDSGTEAPRLGCGQHNHGDLYASNTTGIRPNNDNQCVMCVCQNGNQLCHLKTCSAPSSCSAFINVTDDCCPRCADSIEISWDDPAFYENRDDLLNSHLDEDDCLEGGSIRRNGTTWHPTVISIGPIECITCSCTNGVISCKKDCIPDEKLPCSNPRKRNGQCCKECPDHDVTESEVTDGTTDEIDTEKKGNKRGRGDRNRDREGKKNKHRRRRCKKRKDGKRSKKCRGKSKKGNTPPRPTVATQTGIDLKNLCIPKRTEYLVYKSIGKTEVFLAFDDLTAGTTEVFRWTVSKGPQGSVVSSIDPEVVPSTEYRRQISNTNVVGTTGLNHYRKFKRRLKRKLKRCSDACKPRSVISLLKRVKVHLLKFGEDCTT